MSPYRAEWEREREASAHVGFDLSQSILVEEVWHGGSDVEACGGSGELAL